ncbi:MAG: aspartate--ammonia ligase [Thermofilum sp. ex4484_15]|nr:MAG: aspartate--ammonia ligase [Thermofilum sp. ex4484_15]
MKVKDRTYLAEAPKEGEVTFLSWIHGLRVTKDGLTIKLRDVSGVKEFKAVRGLEKLKLSKESLILIRGFKKGDELTVKEVKVLVRAPPKLPLDPERPEPDKVEDFVKYSYLTIRSPKYVKVFKAQQYVLKYIRDFLYERGFTELLSPLISPCSDPGLRGAKKLRTSFYGRTYELMSSVIMFKQTAVASLEKIFFVARNVREEPKENLSTGRHLCEFTQVDVEWAFADMWDAIKLGEELITYVIERFVDERKDLLKEFDRDLEVPKRPFKIISYDDAVRELAKVGIETPKGKELTFEGEAKLPELYGGPVWITMYPKETRGFYYIEDGERRGYNRDFNLLLPEGQGEVIDGGEREYRYEEIVRRIKGMGEDPATYSWFLELAKVGIPPSSGFGLGVERFTKYILGLKYIWEAAPFPKVPGIVPSP